MIAYAFTGAKGGVGKTLCALAASLSYAEAGKVAVLDLNWVNPDLATILSAMTGEPGNPPSFWTYRLSTPKHTWFVVRPEDPFTLPTRPDHVWGLILEALQCCVVQKFGQPDILIIDTALHPGNFISHTGASISTAVEQALITLSERFSLESIHLWFVWTLAALGDRYNVKASALAARNLSKVLGDAFPVHEGDPVGPDDDPDDEFLNLVAPNFTHVLNPQALFPQKDFFALLADEFGERLPLDVPRKRAEARKEQIVIEGMCELARSTPDARNIPVGYLHKRLEQLRGLPGGYRAIYDSLARDIMNTYQGRRPTNIYPIPEVNRGLFGYTEKVLERPGDVEHIASVEETKELIRPFFWYVDAYLHNRPARCPRSQA